MSWNRKRVCDAAKKAKKEKRRQRKRRHLKTFGEAALKPRTELPPTLTHTDRSPCYLESPNDALASRVKFTEKLAVQAAQSWETSPVMQRMGPRKRR